MKIWIIKMTRKGHEANTSRNDYTDGFVICAQAPKRVRQLAMDHCGKEGKDIWHAMKYSGIHCIGETIGYRTDGLIMRSDCGS